MKDTEKTQQSNDKTDQDNNQNTNNANGNNSVQVILNKRFKRYKKNTVQYVKCEVKFEGSYESIDKLLNTIGKNEKKIVVNSIKLSEDTLDSVKGTINLEIYSIPKIT